jgi:hypothetical protein
VARLRTYSPLNKRSRKVQDGDAAFRAVYAEVDARSGFRCEVSTIITASTMPGDGWGRCRMRATEHHHLFKPRRSHHTAEVVIHACRACHDRMEWPFKRGRLCFLSRMGTAFLFAIRTASDKWAARAD